MGGGRLPKPAHVLCGSPDNHQGLWDTSLRRWDSDQTEEVMNGLPPRYNSDANLAEIARVMRWPGYRNDKPSRKNAGSSPRLWGTVPATEVGLQRLQTNLDLGFSYDLSVGTTKDIPESLYWYRKAAEAGHAKAQTALEYLTSLDFNSESRHNR